jgi:NitT/TauT family transport system permease protein
VRRFVNHIGLWIPLLVFLVLWQIVASLSARYQFLFASPRLVAEQLVRHIRDGQLLIDSAITGAEALLGFLIGTIFGSFLGFCLLYSKAAAAISRPYVLALGAVPIFALAPMMIVWFGVDFKMKVAMATFSTVLVALSQSYQGGRNVDARLMVMFEMYGSSHAQTFWKLILPSSLEWVLASLRLNIGLALLGAFIGEFIASERGLGYAILKASGTYDVPNVLAAALCIVALAFLLSTFVSLFERHRRRIIELVSVPAILRIAADYRRAG